MFHSLDKDGRKILIKNLFVKNNSNQFYWSDDWPVEYTNWDENFDKQTCGYIESSNGKWKTADCDTQFPFICKVTKGLRLQFL